MPPTACGSRGSRSASFASTRVALPSGLCDLSDSSLSVRQREFRPDRSPVEVCRELRRRQPATLFLDGSGGFEESWRLGSIVAVRPEVWHPDASFAKALDGLDDQVRRRRSAGGTAETGIVVLLSYEAEADGVSVEELVDRLLDLVPVP